MMGPTHHLGVRFVHQSSFNSSGQDVGIVLALKPTYKRLQKLPVSSINMLRIFKCKDLVYFNLLPEFFSIIKEKYLSVLTRKAVFLEEATVDNDVLSLQGGFWAKLGKNFLGMKFFLVFQSLLIKPRSVAIISTHYTVL